LWAVHGLDEASISNNLHLALEIDGKLDVERLKTSLAQVLDRHEQLRTVYRLESGSVVQHAVPLEKLPSWFDLADASGWSSSALQADMARRARQPFDLERGPPLRIAAYRRAPDRITLLFCAHHIAIDLWSLLIVVTEIGEAYERFRRGQTHKPPPARSYAEFVSWQQNYVESALGESAWEYWRGQLGHALPVLALPTDLPRLPASDYRGGSEALRLGPELTAALKELAVQQRVSLFALLLAAYQLLLYRYSGQSEIVVGVPSSGRTNDAFAGIVGNCVNPIAVVGHPDPKKCFTGFLREIGEQLRNALVHQNFPFPLLVERLRPERQGDQWPIYQTSFVLQQAQSDVSPGLAAAALGEDSEPFSWCGRKASAMGIRERVENFDLKLMAAATEAGLILSFQFRTALFLPATISRMARHFGALLEGIVSLPEARLCELPLLTGAERRQMVVDWNATDETFPRDACLHELFAAQAARTPDAIAVSFDETRLSYAGLNARSNQLAHYLRSRGVGPDTAVGLCAERSAEMVIGILAVLKAGGAYLPLDPADPKERLAYIIKDAAPLLILTQERFAPSLPESASRFCLDKDWDKITGASTQDPSNVTAPLHLAYVIYTSGSTGRPKGVAAAHLGAVNRLKWMGAYLGVTASDVVLQKTPYGFDVSVWEFFLPLLAGARLAISRPGDHQDPALLAEIIAREGVTILHFVPSMLRAFLSFAGRPALPALRHVVCSGEALSAELRDQFHAGQQAQLHNLYGPTEASIDVTAFAFARDGDEASVAIGRPVWNTRIYILDGALNPVPVNVAGELYIGGAGLARGYLRRAGLTAERFLPDPLGAAGGRLYRTGDLARYRADGNIEYIGRIDHQVKIRGFRIELGEIEAALLGLSGVRDAVAVALEAPSRGKRLIAYVAGGEETEDLKEALRQHLPDYMIPSNIIRLDALPLSPNGKIDRNALPAPQTCSGEENYVAPRTSEEHLLADIWADVLAIPRAGISDNFFALGGDSILSIQVASRARAAGFHLTPRLMFLHPTIAALAPLLQPIAEEKNESAARPCDAFALAELPPEQIAALKAEFTDIDDLYPLTPLQEGMLFHCLLQPGSGVYVLQDQYEIRGKVDADAF
ncbi:MAG: amino acid adenylation domain-containing protein, partial [Beijerinckiaceae bacterium]|nr:amino acid adenylation domain-containing protein [Beijerinckiaceae bacterium]